MNGHFLCLNKDHTIKAVKEEKLEKYLSSHNVMSVLVSVGLDNAQYCLTNPDNVPFDVKALKFEYKLISQLFAIEDGFVDHLGDEVLWTSKENVIHQVFCMIHSLYKLNGADAISSLLFEPDGGCAYLTVDNFNAYIKKGNRKYEFSTRDVAFRDSLKYNRSSYSDASIPYILSGIDKIIGLENDDTLIKPLTSGNIFLIDLVTKEWAVPKSLHKLIKRIEANLDKHDLNMKIGVPGTIMDTINMVMPFDLYWLSKIDNISFGIVAFDATEDDFYAEDIMGSESLCDFYENQLFNDKCYDASSHLYDVPSLIEILYNFRYLYDVWSIMLNSLIGERSACKVVFIAGNTTMGQPHDVFFPISNFEFEEDDRPTGRNYLHEFANMISAIIEIGG